MILIRGELELERVQDGTGHLLLHGEKLCQTLSQRPPTRANGEIDANAPFWEGNRPALTDAHWRKTACARSLNQLG